MRTLSPERRARLLAAGEEAFAARGVGAATVEEITTAAGVAKGTFYLYFRSKDDLVVALRTRFSEELVAAMSADLVTEGEPDWFGRVGQLLESARRAYLAHRPLLAAIADHDPAEPRGERDADWPGRVVAPLTAFIEAGVAAGAFAVDDPPLTALMLFHAIDGLFHDALRQPGDPDPQRVMAAAKGLVSRALAGSR